MGRGGVHRRLSSDRPPKGSICPASLDRTAIERILRAAEALYGPVELGPVVAGDGDRTATWRLTGERGNLTLELAREAADGPLTKVALVPEPIEPPMYAD